jgi:hypothetical protein
MRCLLSGSCMAQRIRRVRHKEGRTTRSRHYTYDDDSVSRVTFLRSELRDEAANTSSTEQSNHVKAIMNSCPRKTKFGSIILKTNLLGAHERRTRATTTRFTATPALRQPRCASRVLVSRPQRLYIDYTVCRRDIVFWAYDYLDYLPRLVSPRKLVEDGSRDINN